MSSLAIKTTCATLKWVSKYDFIFANEEFFFKKINFIRGQSEKTLKRYEFDRNGPKNVSKYDLILANEEFFFSKITFIRG
jgi:hypothetical protein